MGVKDEISGELIRAIKNRDTARTTALRFLLSAIKNREIELRRGLFDEEVQQVVMSLVRQRRESIEEFKKAGRDDLVEKEEKELELLLSFLPPQLSDEEIQRIVEETAREIEAKEMKDMGRLMKAVMPKVKGRAEGRKVNAIVKRYLGG